MMNEVQKMLIELVKAGFPYLECSLSKDMRSEVNYPPLIPVEGLKRGLPASSTAGSLSRLNPRVEQFSRMISAGVSSGGPRPTL